MKMMFAMGALLMLLPGDLGAALAGEEGDHDKIQGAWVVSVAEKAGQKAPEHGLKDLVATFAGDSFTWKMGDEETKGTFALDSAKSPREISMTLGEMKLTGIYRFEGDELKICVAHGDERPTEFATKEGAKVVLLALKRKKP